MNNKMFLKLKNALSIPLIIVVVMTTLYFVFIHLKTVTMNELPQKEKIKMEVQGLANPKEYKESAIVEVTPSTELRNTNSSQSN